MSNAGLPCYLASLYNIDKALAVDTSCVPEIQPLSGCNPSYDTVGSFAIASAKVPDVDKKSIDIGIDAIDGHREQVKSELGMIILKVMTRVQT